MIHLFCCPFPFRGDLMKSCSFTLEVTEEVFHAHNWMVSLVSYPDTHLWIISILEKIKNEYKRREQKLLARINNQEINCKAYLWQGLHLTQKLTCIKYTEYLEPEIIYLIRWHRKTRVFSSIGYSNIPGKIKYLYTIQTSNGILLGIR